jgi:hypothetical protein
MTTAPRWTAAEADYLESLAGELPLMEIGRRYRRHAGLEGWPKRTDRAIEMKLVRLKLPVRVRAGEWLTTGGVADILGCPCTRVEAWFRPKRNREILRPQWRGAFRYVSRRNWRRLARRRPQALGGFSADRLYGLLEDRELAQQVAARYPRPRGDWRVRCVETGQVWPSAVKAAAELHITQAAITLAMRQGRPVASLGMTFEALRDVA